MGQDWRHLSGFMDFLRQLNERGMTILLITHDYKLVCRYARRVVVLADGRVSASGAPSLPLVVADRAGQTVRVTRPHLARTP